MAMITINNYQCPDPTKFDVEFEDFDAESSKRAANGIYNRERIRHGIKKISLQFTMLTATEINSILSAVEPQSFSVSYTAGYFYATQDMYCKNQKVSCKAVPTLSDYRFDISFTLEQF